MKQERLLAILIYISRKKRATAPELAEHFEVSRRTINRDIDSLCLAGVPLITQSGRGGGISLPDNYVLEGGLFPADEIDLNSFYEESTLSKTVLMRQAMEARRDIEFVYHKAEGTSRKRVFPCRIIYKWRAWYLQGWCRKSEDYRLYKFNRLWELVESPGEAPLPPLACPAVKDFFADNYTLEALFNKDRAHRLVDDYGPKAILNEREGRIAFERSFTNYSYMREWVLSFGDSVEVIRPAELREELGETALRMIGIYKKGKPSI